jgi:hypothetical protein
MPENKCPPINGQIPDPGDLIVYRESSVVTGKVMCKKNGTKPCLPQLPIRSCHIRLHYSMQSIYREREKEIHTRPEGQDLHTEGRMPFPQISHMPFKGRNNSGGC